MLVGIHKEPYGKFCRFLERYEQILSYNGIKHIRIEASQADFWERVAELDLFIFRWRQIDDHHQLAKTIIPVIEKDMGVKCFPDMSTCWHFDDKVRQYLLLQQYGFPIIKCWVFWDKKHAIRWLDHAEFPIIFKLKGGAGANNVILVKDKRQARKLITRMFGKGIISGRIPDKNDIRYKEVSLYKIIHKWGGNILRIMRDEDISPDWQIHKNYVLFQKFLPNNKFDTRVTVIGNRAFAFRRFNRDNDFRASGSGKIDYDKGHIDIRSVKLALSISSELNFQSMAYDIIFDRNDDPQIIEISYTFIPDAVDRCSGYWDSHLNWHEGHCCPQFLQLREALKMPDLKQPE